MKVGIIGTGTMGAGIAQVALMSGNEVSIYDSNSEALKKGSDKLKSDLDKLVAKGKLTLDSVSEMINKLSPVNSLNQLSNSDIIIEAIVENPDVKKNLFNQLETIVRPDCILASNTSSLSITSIAGSTNSPARFIGIHFFNPAPVMKLVEIIPAIQTDKSIIDNVVEIIKSWGKTTVLAKDTPGFIVNRIARPYYSEAIRIMEEGIADIATIDWAMTELAGFRMGPFTLMDFIGLDVNYSVTESVWSSCYYEPRYKPSFTQKRLVEAGYLGKKSNRGFYDYTTETNTLEPVKDIELGKKIMTRILSMLINEAYDALYFGIASKEDIDLAMTIGVNYPKGLLSWGIELGLDNCRQELNKLYEYYHEERYRCSPALNNNFK